MTESPLSFHEVAARLHALAEQLKRTTDAAERQVLLKQFRILLDQAEKGSRGNPYQPDNRGSDHRLRGTPIHVSVLRKGDSGGVAVTDGNNPGWAGDLRTLRSRVSDRE
jgi:hypothetical protein